MKEIVQHYERIGCIVDRMNDLEGRLKVIDELIATFKTHRQDTSKLQHDRTINRMAFARLNGLYQKAFKQTLWAA